MRTDGTFTLKQVDLPNWTNSRTLTLIPFGDVHHDSPSHCATAWGEFLDRVDSAPKDTLFLGMGDYLDSYSTTERAIVGDGRLHESTTKRMEREGRERVKVLASQLRKMKGRLIGLMGGNHFIRFNDGSTSDMLLANLLETSYLGACCGVKLTFRHSGKQASVDIFAHHGKGGGTTAGGRLNSVEKLANIADADIYLMGDNHARGALPVGDRLRLVSNSKVGLTLRSRTPWIGRTGSFLKAYEPGESNYVVDAAMSPSSLGWIEFYIRLKRSMDDFDLKIESRQ